MAYKIKPILILFLFVALMRTSMAVDFETQVNALRNDITEIKLNSDFQRPIPEPVNDTRKIGIASAPDIFYDPSVAKEVPFSRSFAVSKGASSSVGISVPNNFISKTEARDRLNKALNLTREILNKAVEKTHKYQYEYKKVLSAFDSGEVSYPKPGYDFSACQQYKIGAFHLQGSSREVFLCAETFYTDIVPADALSQVLIHEFSHVAGYDDECDATNIEVNAMKDGYGKIAFKNNYMKACGIDVSQEEESNNSTQIFQTDWGYSSVEDAEAALKKVKSFIEGQKDAVIITAKIFETSTGYNFKVEYKAPREIHSNQTTINPCGMDAERDLNKKLEKYKSEGKIIILIYLTECGYVIIYS